MNALRAQAVAARSFGLSQNRYSYAKTCDTSSCQVYGGSATRPSADLGGVRRRRARAHATRRSPRPRARSCACATARIVSTEFSASNGPADRRRRVPAGRRPVGRRARQPQPRLDADHRRRCASPSTYGLANANGVAHRARRRCRPSTASGPTRSSAERRHARHGVGLPQRLRAPVAGLRAGPDRARRVTTARPSSFIGDSVGDQRGRQRRIRSFRILLDGVFASTTFDTLVSRPTQGGSIRRRCGGCQRPCRSAPTWSWSSSATTTRSGAMAGAHRRRHDRAARPPGRPRRMGQRVAAAQPSSPPPTPRSPPPPNRWREHGRVRLGVGQRRRRPAIDGSPTTSISPPRDGRVLAVPARPGDRHSPAAVAADRGAGFAVAGAGVG